VSYDDGEDAVSRLSWVDEWIADGEFMSAAQCARERLLELRDAPAETLASISGERWAQVRDWARHMPEERLAEYLRTCTLAAEHL
jgi:hypothetical protein